MTILPPTIKGWCPGALRPMESGDGLILRIRLTGGVLSGERAKAIAGLARRFGNGQLDLTQRANLQLRGVDIKELSALQGEIHALGLLDPDTATEAVRNIIAPPLSGVLPGQFDGAALVRELEARLQAETDLHRLPGKFGFLIDDGSGPSLAGIPCDIRLEPAGGGVAIRLGGTRDVARLAAIVPEGEAVSSVLGFARAFLTHTGARRMRDVAALLVPKPIPDETISTPASLDDVIGRQPGFMGVGFAYGRMTADHLELLGDFASRDGLRLTPFRAIFLPGVDPSASEALIDAGFITRSDDPRLRIAACPGKPACPSGQIETRALADRLASVLPEGVRLHVSGCAKGCAHPAPADITLTGTEVGIDFIVEAQANAAPDVKGLEVDSVLARIAAYKKPESRPVTVPPAYIRDGAEIYRRSFAIIRSEADLKRFSAEEEKVAVRIIHACGMVEVAADIVFSEGAVAAAKAALINGAPILCDAKMVANGVTRSRLPADNQVICTLDDPRTAGIAADIGNTRSAAAMELWRPHLAGAVVAIGNAPTSLFHLFEMIDAGAPMPAAVIGMPVGFVGAAESKEALIADPRFRSMIIRGRKGGSAMTAAAVNALASERE